MDGQELVRHAYKVARDQDETMSSPAAIEGEYRKSALSSIEQQIRKTGRKLERSS
jgi:hypothetical protein